MAEKFSVVLLLFLLVCISGAPSRSFAGTETNGSRQSAPPPCRAKTLEAFRPIPKLDYQCADSDEESLSSPERSEGLKLFMRELEKVFSAPAWWEMPVDELNVCAVTGEARPMSIEERRDFEAGLNIRIYGDGDTRLVIVDDPCVRYSYLTLNAFILRRADGKVYASQVLDAFFTRFDGPLDLQTAELNGATLVLVRTITMDGTFPPSPYATYSAFAVDPRSRRAVPKKLFKVGGKLTNIFRYANYIFDDEKLEKQWREPELVREGRLSPVFSVQTLSKGRFTSRAYVWNGAYYEQERGGSGKKRGKRGSKPAR